jgi:hypothetical protein
LLSLITRKAKEQQTGSNIGQEKVPLSRYLLQKKNLTPPVNYIKVITLPHPSHSERQ